MDITEIFVFGASCFVILFKFLPEWFVPLGSAEKLYKNTTAKAAGWLTSLVVLFIYIVTLVSWAAHDVVGFWIIFYILLGFALQYAAMWLIGYGFDMHWAQDVLHTANRAAVPAYSGAFVGFALIYAGANVGEGPSWWCVIVAGGLGWAAYLLLGMLLNAAGNVFERITVERDIGCGIRTGGYLLGAGLILARASAGDWTSFTSTIIELAESGWPVLVLAGVALVVELLTRGKDTTENKAQVVAVSTVLAILYIAFGVVAVLLAPQLAQNPIYDIYRGV